MTDSLTTSITLPVTPQQMRELIANPTYNIIRLSAFYEGTNMVFGTTVNAPALIRDNNFATVMEGVVTDVKPGEVVEITMYDDTEGATPKTLSAYKERYEITGNADHTSTLNIYCGTYYRPGREEHYTSHVTMRKDALERMKAIPLT